MRKEEEESDVGLGDKWRIFVKSMQAIWEQGCVPEQMKWEIIVLLPKGGVDYRGIGLLDPFWKVAEKIMVAQFTPIKFHDSLHGGLAKRGTGTATIEAKLHQSLAWHDQCPLYQIYLDLKKTYSALDRDREQTLDIWRPMESGQRCWLFRNISGTQKNWCAGPGAITGRRLALREALHRGAHSPLSCSKCVLMP